MDGDGRADYFYVDQYGVGHAYLNQLDKGNDKWTRLGVIATGVNAKRDDIRMAVLTLSGRADYLVVSPDEGRTMWWENHGMVNGVWIWTPRGEVASGVSIHIGPSFHGKNVRFAGKYFIKLHPCLKSALSMP